MKNIFTYIIPLVALLFIAVSCGDKQAPQGGAQGSISLALQTDRSSDDISVTKATVDPLYQIDIVEDKVDGSVVQSFPDHTQLPASIPLNPGKYVVKAISQAPAAFDSPSFYGEAKTTVTTGNTQAVEITATLDNVIVVSVLDQTILDNFTRADLVITEGSDDQELFRISKADRDRLAYIRPTATLNWALILTNLQGENYQLTGTIEDVKPRTRYDFKFKVSDPTAETDGGVHIDLTIDRNLVEFSHTMLITLQNGPAPKVTPQGNFILGQPIIVNELTRGKEVRYNITAECGLSQVWFYHQVESMEAAGIPRAVKLTNITPDMRAKFQSLGIEWSSLLYEQTTAYIDLSNFCNTMSLGEYDMRFTLQDNPGQPQGQYLVQDINISILPDQDHMALKASAWAKFVDLQGEWYTLDQSTTLTFQYKTNEATEWVSVPTDQVTYNGETKTFRAKVTGLNPNTKYTYRTYSDEKIGSENTFTTENAPDLPFLNFDEKHYRDTGSGLTGAGGVWFLGTDANFWATGNPGTKVSLSKVGKNITETTDDAIKGKAVRMESVGGVYIAGHAAGNLFSGTFAISGLPTSTGAMRKSVNFGRPYTGRPTGLKGYYKYTSKTVTIDTDGMHRDMVGQPDRCQIFISLENWNGAQSRPGTPNVVAYGELVSPEEGADMGQYEPFEFRLDYKRTDIKPTHIVFIATSSIYGGDFCGGVGSVLCIDEFELLWD